MGFWHTVVAIGKVWCVSPIYYFALGNTPIADKLMVTFGLI